MIKIDIQSDKAIKVLEQAEKQCTKTINRIDAAITNIDKILDKKGA